MQVIKTFLLHNKNSFSEKSFNFMFFKASGAYLFIYLLIYLLDTGFKFLNECKVV